MRLLACLIVLATTSSYAGNRVRHIECHEEKIITIRTAIGIATIIQVPDRPNSVVVGDQDKFKVEYLEQAITIKPLQSGAKSNLYIYTDYRRYNVQLVTGSEHFADYVVYLENEKPKVTSKQNSLRWLNYGRSMKNDEFTFHTNRIAKTSDGILLIEFNVTALKKGAINPEWIWLTQESKVRPIQNLFLSSLKIDSGKSSTGTIQILSKDIDPTRPLKIELRRKKTTAIVLPKANQWK